jgi:hypothetical protein
MSLRVDAAGEHVRRTANLPTSTAFTICGWFKRVVAGTGTYRYLLSIEDTVYPSGSSNYCLLGWNNANSFSIAYTSGGAAFASEPAVGDWFFAALRCSGTGATDLQGRWAGVGATSFVTANTQGITFTTASVTFLSDSWDEIFNGNGQHLRCWDAALTDNELWLEMHSLFPVRLTNLNFAWRDISATSITDIGPNQRSATTAGTMAIADDPPVSDTMHPGFGDFVSSSSGAMNGSITVNLSQTGAMTGTGNMAGAVSSTFTPTGALTGTGAMTGDISAALTATGVLSGVGAMVGSITNALSVVGAMTGDGALTASINLTLSPTGALIGDGALTGLIDLAASLVGDISGTGDMSATITLSTEITSAFTGVGALTCNIPLTLSLVGDLSDLGSGDMDGSIALVSSMNGALTGDGALAGSVSLAASISGALTGMGALTGSISLTSLLSGALTGDGALASSIALTSSVVGVLTDDNEGEMVGAISVGITPSGEMTGTGALTGLVSMAFSATAIFNIAGELNGSVSISVSIGGTLLDAGALSQATRIPLTGTVDGRRNLIGVSATSVSLTGVYH